MASKYAPPSIEIAIAARGIAALIRRQGHSYQAACASIKDVLGWDVSHQSVMSWFDKDTGAMIPVTKPEPPAVAKRTPAPALAAIEASDPSTVDIGWRLRCIIVKEMDHIDWIQTQAVTSLDESLRLDVAAYAVPHIRALGALMAGIPTDATAKPGEIADDPMNEYISAFEGDK